MWPCNRPEWYLTEFHRFSRHKIVQKFIKLSAAVHALSYWQSFDDAETILPSLPRAVIIPTLTIGIMMTIIIITVRNFYVQEFTPVCATSVAYCRLWDTVNASSNVVRTSSKRPMQTHLLLLLLLLLLQSLQRLAVGRRVWKRWCHWRINRGFSWFSETEPQLLRPRAGRHKIRQENNTPILTGKPNDKVRESRTHNFIAREVTWDWEHKRR